MTWYQTGTVAVTNGGTTIAGTGTDWSDQGVGWWMWIDGETAPVEIAAVVSSTQITARNPIQRATASGLSYLIIPTQGLTLSLREQIAELITTVQNTKASWDAVVADFSATAYQLWLDEGNTGTAADFLADLQGDKGWSPVLATVTDGERRVHQVAAWQGGEGTAPATGKYLGAAGLVDTAAEGTDLRGATGATGATGAKGDTGALLNNITGAYLGAALAERPLSRKMSFRADLRNQVYARGDRSGLKDATDFDTLWDFTRSTVGYDFNAAGARTEYAVNVPRFGFERSTGARNGLIVEPGATYLLLNTNGNLATQNVAVTAQAYTLAFYGTGTVTLSGASTAGPLVGTASDERVTLTFTPTAGTLTLTVSGTVTDAKMVAGVYAPTVFPTAGGSLIRTADQLDVNPAVVADVLSADAGTVLIEATLFDTGASQVFADILIAGSGFRDRIQLGAIFPTGLIQVIGVGGGVVGDPAVPGTITWGVPFRLVVTWGSRVAACLNGGAVDTSTTTVKPATIDVVEFGRSPTGGNRTAGYFTEIEFALSEFTDAELQEHAA